MSIEQAWPGLAAALSTLALVLGVRRFLPADHRHRPRTAIGLLFASALLVPLVFAAEAFGAPRASGALDFLSELSLALGIAALADLLIFDLVLEKVRVHVPGILRDVLLGTGFLVILFVLLGNHGVDLLPLVTTSAVLTAVVGLALQSTIANLFAGLSMQLDRSFAIGDWIQVGPHVGRIFQIKWRSTSILTRDNDVLVVPNGQLTTHEVMNLSGPSRWHRVTVRIAFHYRHAPNDVKAAIVEALRGIPGVLSEPAPTCLPAVFADSGIEYRIHYWIDDPARETNIDGEVRTRIWSAARRAALEIPFPIRTLLVPSAQDGGPLSEVDERLALIERIDVLSPLDAADRRMLAERMRELHFAGGERIIQQGEAGDSLFLVKSGQVAVLFEQDGVARPVATLGPRDFFGEMSLFTGEPRAATCAARSDVCVYVIDHASFGLLLESKPPLVDELSAVLGRRVIALRAKEAESRSNASLESESRRVVTRIREFFNLRS